MVVVGCGVVTLVPSPDAAFYSAVKDTTHTSMYMSRACHAHIVCAGYVRVRDAMTFSKLCDGVEACYIADAVPVAV